MSVTLTKRSKGSSVEISADSPVNDRLSEEAVDDVEEVDINNDDDLESSRLEMILLEDDSEDGRDRTSTSSVSFCSVCSGQIRSDDDLVSLLEDGSSKEESCKIVLASVLGELSTINFCRVNSY